MNDRQLRALVRRNQISKNETIATSVVATLIGILIILTLGLLINTVLGDKGLVCREASKVEFVQLGCK